MTAQTGLFRKRNKLRTRWCRRVAPGRGTGPVTYWPIVSVLASWPMLAGCGPSTFFSDVEVTVGGGSQCLGSDSVPVVLPAGRSKLEWRPNWHDDSVEEPTRALMQKVREEIEAALESDLAVVEARQSLLTSLADGQPHFARELIDAFESDPSGQELVYPPGSTPDTAELGRPLARRAAANEALGLLCADGITVRNGP